VAKRASTDLWSRLRPIVRASRAQPTEAEDVLWQGLRRHSVAGFKFRRQHVIDRFVADFYCAKARLVIEVDGPIHDFSREEDAMRQQFLESLHLRVLRFNNDEVLGDLDGVLRRIEDVVTSPPTPSPHRGEGTKTHGTPDETR
jgi:very-short-patch-repair endonuclease